MVLSDDQVAVAQHPDKAAHGAAQLGGGAQAGMTEGGLAAALLGGMRADQDWGGLAIARNANTRGRIADVIPF